jgi:uncharacterized membrane protein
MRSPACWSSNELRRVAILLAVILTLVYPLTIWFAEGEIEPRVLAGLLLLAGLSRLVSGDFPHGTHWWTGSVLLLVLLAVWANVMFPLKLYPVIVNAMLLGVFAYSLFVPPSAIERIARMREPQLPQQAIAYTRRVTQVWCGFFAVNGAIALYTALYSSSAHWSLYNGFIAYILIGLLFAGEYCVRRHVIGQHRD